MPILGLGHTGLWVTDLAVMRDFYERVDPEGNRCEVYLRIDRDVRQPFRKSLNLEQSAADVHAEAGRLLTDGGPAYQPATWTPVPDSTQASLPGHPPR
jgi:catechol 2,3-dioxygenase-like lactoylglutathione lyase family enzyme